MTTENDRHGADSGRPEEEKIDARVIEAVGPEDDPEVILVQYPDGSQEYEPASPENQALFGEGAYADIDGYNEYGDVALVGEVVNDQYWLDVDDVEIRVPSDHRDELIDAVTSAAPEQELTELYYDIIEDQVQRDQIRKFEERFPDERVEQTADGWIVDDTFLVTYEAENFLVDVDVKDPHGNEFDESKQGVYLDLETDGERTIVAPDGDQVTLTEQEQLFLAMVESLLFPEDYFGVELVDDIEQYKAESFGDTIEDITEQTEVTGFTDSKTGIYHGSDRHDFNKHDVTDLNVTEEVREKLWSNPYDHSALHELLLRKQEFINNPDVDIFADQTDDSEFKWEEIEKTSENAPIPQDVRNKLDSMFA